MIFSTQEKYGSLTPDDQETFNQHKSLFVKRAYGTAKNWQQILKEKLPYKEPCLVNAYNDMV